MAVDAIGTNTEIKVKADTSKAEKISSAKDEPIREVDSPSVWGIGAGIGAGMLLSGYAQTIPNSVINGIIGKKLSAIPMTKTEEKLLSAAGNKALKMTGLYDKGVRILRAGKTGITDWAPNKRFLKNYINSQHKVIEEVVKKGENAFFTPYVNKVIMPPKGTGSTQYAILHELGHAVNANVSTLGKFLQKARFLSNLALPILAISMFKTKKAEDEKPVGTLDTVTTFIKNNAGKLTFASLLPLVAEEGLASIRGASYAKKLLSPKMASKVNRFQGLAFLTYLSVAVLSGLGASLAVKIKDNIASRNLIDYDKHFDFDGDGKLSPSESKAKETYISGRKEEKEKLYKQFDLNNNGLLESDEKAAMEAFLQEA